MTANHRPVLLAVAGLSAAVLAVEIGLTRIASMTMWYHFAFLVLTLAMLGLGAAGTWLACRGAPDDPLRLLRRSAWALALACAGNVALSIWVYVDPFMIAIQPMQLLPLLVRLSGAAVLFFAGGLGIGAALSARQAPIGKIYRADLLAAAAGALGGPLLLPYVGGGGLLLVAGAVALFSIYPISAGFARRMTVIVGCLMIGLGIVQPELQPLTPCGTKYEVIITGESPGARVLWRRWTSLARVDVQQPGPSGLKLSLLGRGSRAKENIPPLLALHTDGGATTYIYELDDASRLGRDPQAGAFAAESLYASGYPGADNEKVLVIGAGGGIDVLTALHFGAREVTAVELSVAHVQAVRNQFSEYSGRLFHDERVQPVVDEGRSFLLRDQNRYDLIQLSGVDTFAGLQGGAYTLSENFLYTVEAVEDALDHLKPGGVVVYLRWLFIPPRETLRLLATARVALEQRGVADPSRHLVVCNAGPFATIMISRDPLGEKRLQAVQAWADQVGVRVMLRPGDAASDDPFHRIVQEEDLERFLEDYPFDLRPSTDDWPFFYLYYRWDKLKPLPNQSGGWLGGTLPLAQVAVVVLLLMSLIGGAVLIAIPFLFRQNRGLPKAERATVFAVFFLIGIAFMSVEIALLARGALLLGHPAWAFPVILGGLLAPAGLGAAWATRRDRVWLPLALALAVAALILLWRNQALDLVHVVGGWPLPGRIAVTLAGLFPLGVVMGGFFPLSLQRARGVDARLAPWAWAINGCASVLGATLATIAAMTWGFTLVFSLALTCYLLAGLLMYRLPVGVNSSKQ